MGSLIGHIVPGSFFLLFSLWWSVNIFTRYFSAHLHKKPIRSHHGYTNSISFARPVEIYVKLGALVVAIIGEYLTAIDDKWKVIHQGNLQHIMMYLFFAIHPLMELLYYYKFEPLPANLDYLAAMLAFGVEAFLFSQHLHGRSKMDVQLHTYLIYVVILTVLASAVEMTHPHDLRPALLRSTLTLLQGTWFFQVGFTLYPLGGISHWNQEDHSEMMIITVIFTMHLAIALLFQAVLGVVIYLKVKRQFAFQELRMEDFEDSDAEMLVEQKDC